jgi:hypothetical protein
MKPLHIVLLVCAGALGGAVVTKVWHKHPAPEVARVEQPAAPQNLKAAEPAAPAAANTAAAPSEKQKPSPTGPSEATEKPKPTPPAAPPATAGKAAGHPERTGGPALQPPKFHKNWPPAHPRPLILGQAASPAPQAPKPLSIPPVAAPPTAAVQEAAPVQEPAQMPVQTAAPAAAPEPEAPHKVTLNAGMLIPVRLVDGLSSDRNVAGDTFTGTLDRELVVDGFIIAERGARVEGRVVSSDHGTKVKGDAAIAVELTRIHTSDGQNVAIQTDSFERRSTANHGTDAVKIGGGAALGAIIGAIAGGGKGAAIGAGAGGGVGAGDVLLTRKPATLPSEMRIRFRLRAPVTLTEKKG